MSSSLQKSKAVFLFPALQIRHSLLTQLIESILLEVERKSCKSNRRKSFYVVLFCKLQGIIWMMLLRPRKTLSNNPNTTILKWRTNIVHWIFGCLFLSLLAYDPMPIIVCRVIFVILLIGDIYWKCLFFSVPCPFKTCMIVPLHKVISSIAFSNILFFTNTPSPCSVFHLHKLIR